jgi:hypothetical protein
MKDTEFFQRALERKAPWKVMEDKMDLTAKTVEVIIGCEWACPGWMDTMGVAGSCSMG